MAAKSGGSKNDSWLPLWVHLSDTVGVIRYLIDMWLPMESSDMQLEKDALMTAASFLAAAHDLGKATPLFQIKILPYIPGLKEKLEDTGLKISYEPTQQEMKKYGVHSVLGAVLLTESECPCDYTVIVASHHGTTPGMGFDDEDADNSIQSRPLFYRDKASAKEWKKVQQDYTNYVLKTTGISSFDELPRLSWKTQLLLTGMLVMADWIASNTAYFPLIPIDNTEVISPTERIHEGLTRLKLPKRWISKIESPYETMQKQFCFTPNTMQEMVIEAGEAICGPGLAILEAPMGNGKTEAALILAEQLAEKAGKNGIAFFLPSQATSNSIFTRLKEWAVTLDHDGPLAIQLAHGMAAFQSEYAEMCEAVNDDQGQPDLIVHQFFRGSKSRLLANFVVGTIDQLLMAALKQKHVMLRHLGIAGKVVIIDECHAYDAYMNVYLDRVLGFLRLYNVPVILLSATLPADRRISLVKAYLGKSIKASNEELRIQAYPMMTTTEGESVKIRHVELKTSGTRITINRIGDEDIVNQARIACQAGGCVGIIVNTVMRAQEIAARIRSIDGAKVILYHAQFVMPDRIKQEEALLGVVGKKSTPEERRGVIVVGTQVLEQSLDIDFDLMITDLCPVDLLLQRMGRLHRHTTRTRPEALQEATCCVLGANDPDRLDGAAVAIYGEYLLQRSLAFLPSAVEIPTDIPKLVQSVYDESDAKQGKPLGFPEAYKKYAEQRDNRERKAELNCLPILQTSRRGITTICNILNENGSISEDSARALVRDGDPSIEVLVIVECGEGQFCLLSDENTILDGEMVLPIETAKRIARYRLRLPHRLSNSSVYEKTIATLRTETEQRLRGWLRSPWLHDELFLILDENQSKKLLERFDLKYSEKEGLMISDERQKR